MWTSIKECYRESTAIALALPLLLAVPALAEFTQHIIEYRIGMFESAAAMQANAEHPARMAWGMVKVLALFLMIYWVSRAMAFGRGGAKPVLGDARSARLFAAVLLVNLALTAAELFGSGLLAPLVGAAAARWSSILLLVLGAAVIVYLSVWAVGAALGNRALTIRASFRIMHGNFWWSVGFSLLAQLPLIALHYALNFGGMGRSAGLLWTLLTLDALLVGYLGIVIGAMTYLVARRAAGRAGVPLT